MLLKKKMMSYTFPDPFVAKGIWPYNRAIESEQATEVQISGRKVLMFGSNSYLGLTNHPRLKEAGKNAIDKYGTGCAGSRFLNGTLDLHVELEHRLARFVGKESALAFSTGFQVNLGVISCIPGRHDYVILDELNHACILDGARLSFGKTFKYGHNDMAHLERILSKLEPDRIKLIVIDGVFSMEGDIAKLPEILDLAKKYQANVMIDDAHGLGVLGPGGRGTAAHFGKTDEVDLIMGTFSKSLATIGGFVAADKETIHYIKHHARTMIFSASLAPANAASVIAALNVLEDEPERIENLWKNTYFAHKVLTEAGMDIGHSETPIIPIFVRDNYKTFMLTHELYQQGVFVNPVVTPAVSSEESLIRFSLMATHTQAQIEEALDKIISIAKRIGVEMLPHPKAGKALNSTSSSNKEYITEA